MEYCNLSDNIPLYAIHPGVAYIFTSYELICAHGREFIPKYTGEESEIQVV